MPYDPSRHHRRSIRLRGYDYAQPGAYFVTICAHGRQPLFGALGDTAMHLNDAGRMISRWWQELNHKYPTVRTDAFIVMPDHMHGLVIIDADADGAPDADRAPEAGGYINPPLCDDPAAAAAGGYINPPLCDDPASVRADLHIRPSPTMNTAAAHGPLRPSLPAIIQWFKIMTTTEYIRCVKHCDWPPFDRRVWQRGYWERIIHDDRHLANVRRYVAENPQRHAARRAALDALLARMTYHDR